MLAWISNYIQHSVWDEITSPFSNFNGQPLKFVNGEVISFHIYMASDYLYMLRLKLIQRMMMNGQ